MADAKISALTGATTPVAGTEVLPIVQSGSTKKVSIDNLTKGRTVNASSFDTDVAAAGVTLSGTTLAADGTDANIDINLTPKGTGEVNIPKVDIDGGAIDGVTIGTNSVVTDLKVDNLRMDGSTLSGTATNGDMFVSPNGTGRLLLGNGDQADIVAGAFAAGGSANNNIDVLFWHRTPFLAYTGKLRSTLEYGAGGAEAGSMSLYLKSGGVDYRNMLWEPDGTITVDRGNLKIGTSGKGIDFSVTPNPAGMQSELLADYEEGVWTPTLATDGTNFTSVTYSAQNGGWYVRIGKTVFVHGTLYATAVTVGGATGSVVMGGLPYANMTGGLGGPATSAGSVANTTGWTTNAPMALITEYGGSRLYLMRFDTAGTFTNIAVANVAGGTNLMQFAMTYQVD